MCSPPCIQTKENDETQEYVKENVLVSIECPKKTTKTRHLTLDHNNDNAVV